MMTKEQFGYDLYDCIKAFSARDWARQAYNVEVTNLNHSVAVRKRRLADLKAIEADMEARILALMPTIGHADKRTLLAKYEQLQVVK